MRIYVLINDARPMKLHLFREGLVRFSSARYDCKDLTNQFSHLTNSSINKYASSFGGGTSYGSEGKWTFAQLKSYFVSNNLNWDVTWVKIETVII
jgi:tubulin polyglutamylase TTLL2